MRKKRKSEKLAGLMAIPVGFSFLSVIFQSLWLIPVAVFTMFFLVGTLPFCRKHENLWIFILTSLSALPVNGFLLVKFNVLKIYMFGGSEIIHVLIIIEYILILIGTEQIVFGLMA